MSSYGKAEMMSVVSSYNNLIIKFFGNFFSASCGIRWTRECVAMVKSVAETYTVVSGAQFTV